MSININWSEIITKTLASFLTALLIGACIIVWHGATSVDSKIKAKIDEMDSKIEAVKAGLAVEIATSTKKTAEKMQIMEELEERLKRSEERIKRLDELTMRVPVSESKLLSAPKPPASKAIAPTKSDEKTKATEAIKPYPIEKSSDFAFIPLPDKEIPQGAQQEAIDKDIQKETDRIQNTIDLRQIRQMREAPAKAW